MNIANLRGWRAAAMPHNISLTNAARGTAQQVQATRKLVEYAQKNGRSAVEYSTTTTCRERERERDRHRQRLRQRQIDREVGQTWIGSCSDWYDLSRSVKTVTSTPCKAIGRPTVNRKSYRYEYDDARPCTQYTHRPSPPTVTNTLTRTQTLTHACTCAQKKNDQ